MDDVMAPLRGRQRGLRASEQQCNVMLDCQRAQQAYEACPRWRLRRRRKLARRWDMAVSILQVRGFKTRQTRSR